MTAKEIIEYMESLRNEEQRKILMGFFKTAPGEYGYGDEFLGLKVPQTREVVRLAGQSFPLSEIPELLMNRWHEVRLCGFLILVAEFGKLSTKRLENDAEAIRKRDEILTMYLQYAERANDWDLVDLSVHKILGHWQLLPTYLGRDIDSKEYRKQGIIPKVQDSLDYKKEVLDELAASDCLWKQRMSIVCTWKTSQQGDPSWCLRYAEIHLHHPHDLMHKAVGWMLREMGKRVSMDLLRDFLRQHAHEMPRTMLRYAIEKMPESERKEWMSVPTDKFKSDYVIKANPFAGIPVSDFVDIILQQEDNRDEAMYYLLHQRLNRQLRERYDANRHNILDDFDDMVEDFFLYLREGKDGKNRFPYQSLQRIKNKDAFEKWLLTTFRNYLSNRAEAEQRIATATYSDQEFNGFHGFATPDALATDMAQGQLTDEQKILVCSHLIAYAHQVFYPRGRFIFLRSLLTILNKQKALPNEEVALALGMTHISYRVTVHRMKGNLTKFRQRLLCGEHLRLDEEHQQIAKQICDDFSHLYPTLLGYYTQTINTLKCADAIKQLRQEHYETTGLMAHEPTSDDYTHITIKAFWNILNRLLIV